MPIFEWFCGEHGAFEGSHPICPAYGCQSKEVVKEFRTPPGYLSGTTKRTDAGLRKTAEAYRLPNLLSAKEGESSKPNNRAGEMLWGNQGAQFIQSAVAQQAPQFELKDPKTGKKGVWKDYGGLATVAKETPIQNRVLPAAADVTAHQSDRQQRSALKKSA